jgi:hypothetical protein
VRLDRVSAATVACTHYYGCRFFGLTPPQPKAEESIRLVREAWAQGVIDNPANLADDRVWLFHGEQDKIVPDGAFDALSQLYSGLGVRQPNLGLATGAQRRAANHGVPVAKFSGTSQFPVRRCNEHAPPFVIECGFDAAELLLRHLHPQGFNEAADDQHRDGTLIAFDQTEFFNPGDERASLHRVGYVYLPKRCADESCRVHIAFHGCRQNVDSVHDDFVRDAGYNSVAASNGIVVLYPQVANSTANPNGCWDFWGYTGASYLSKDGPQMRAVKAMVDRLLGEL